MMDENPIDPVTQARVEQICAQIINMARYMQGSSNLANKDDLLDLECQCDDLHAIFLDIADRQNTVSMLEEMFNR